jgi:hypothetical protein
MTSSVPPAGRRDPWWRPLVSAVCDGATLAHSKVRALGATMDPIGNRPPDLALRGHPPSAGGHGCPRRAPPRRDEPWSPGRNSSTESAGRGDALAGLCRGSNLAEHSESAKALQPTDTRGFRLYSETRAAEGRHLEGPEVLRQPPDDQAPGAETASTNAVSTRPASFEPTAGATGDNTRTAIAMASVARARVAHPRRPLAGPPRKAPSLLYIIVGLALTGMLFGLLA